MKKQPANTSQHSQNFKPSSTPPKSANVKTSETTAKVDTLQAKTWNPNNPDSWEPDMRGYHSVEGSDYPLPSDEIEQNRLELQHYGLRARFQGDIVCPEARELIKSDGTKILDVGCAKGFWLESIQKKNPFCDYHGVDIDDDSSFDYVHQRLLIMGIPKNKFSDAIKELIRVTKPGGWIELVEIDMVVYQAGPYSKQLSTAMLDAMQARGLDCYAATNLKWYTTGLSANISNQDAKTVILPSNDETPVGKLTERNLHALFLGMEDWMHKSMGITREEYRRLVENSLAESIGYKSFWLASALYFQVTK
ncbi:hypothetical protein HK100_012178 [Physocladia obscura]|uniref:Methyltransferase domain-containing protein n=1 Tax=Physocladia obscura TaxID=109957 RepID=A0AAD5XDH6_9FUNG|nr:hypothetical protein HK100_012178 [Physocladia obscura]